MYILYTELETWGAAVVSGNVMEWENKRNQKIPGSLPARPGNL
jgi:hypothetical protein